jgi:hypothetical protein
MAYQRLTGFMYSEVGEKVGAWRREGEPAIVPLSLPAIVQGYVDAHSRLSVLLLKREIHGYLRNNLTPGGLRNAAPFDYELCFQSITSVVTTTSSCCGFVGFWMKTSSVLSGEA